MANSLHEQLLKAGLVDDKRVNKAKKAKQRKEKEQRHRKQKTEDEAARLARQARARDVQRDRELNLARQAEAQRKAVAAQIRQLVEMNQLPLEDGERAYHFSDAGNCSPCSDSSDEDVNLTVRILPDFFCSGFSMDFWVGGICELLRHKRIRHPINEFFRFFDCSSHPFRSWCQHEFRPKSIK